MSPTWEPNHLPKSSTSACRIFIEGVNMIIPRSYEHFTFSDRRTGNRAILEPGSPANFSGCRAESVNKIAGRCRINRLFIVSWRTETLPPVLNRHNMKPLRSSSAYTASSAEPANTLPSATVGPDHIRPSVVNLQTRSPVFRLTARTCAASVVMKIMSSVTAAAPVTEPPESYD